MSRALTTEAYEAIVDDLAYRYHGTIDQEAVAEAVARAREQLEPLSTVPDFLPILVERFARDQLLAAAQAQGRVARATPELLFVCVHNSGRSVMAAALARHLSAGRVHVRSAGSAPTGQIQPVAIEVLAERGVVVEGEFPKPLTGDVVHAADVIVTMGCGDSCPYVPGRRYLDWDVADPDGQPLPVVRAIRDDIQARVTALLAEVLDDHR
ncbi:arsenate reductase ArsC [Janibacter alkaliphilus]|uniref:Protein-tyrosine-phosphatase/Arc/MetJ family transcription regulator n=1 Tax=Janibacter alkaliphilus TaxID=1069963 RepID=A0A852X0T3_9MICO|nr:arsenate reductase ArsC [Janibacter alkaliphilus]NYG36097.1 protein-tyrosine-phosphatase/Arc/MetJ family transcription regulator [Janibacter alkaliphilus]